jgi:cytoskeletal protein RodZ
MRTNRPLLQAFLVILFFCAGATCIRARARAPEPAQQDETKPKNKSRSSQSQKDKKSAPDSQPTPSPKASTSSATTKDAVKASTPANPGPSSGSGSADPRSPLKKTIVVWVNTASKAYHLPGSRWYGKTKHGKYMTEEDARKAGYHPAGRE